MVISIKRKIIINFQTIVDFLKTGAHCLIIMYTTSYESKTVRCRNLRCSGRVCLSKVVTKSFLFTISSLWYKICSLSYLMLGCSHFFIYELNVDRVQYRVCNIVWAIVNCRGLHVTSWNLLLDCCLINIYPEPL